MDFQDLTAGGIRWQLREPPSPEMRALLGDPDFWLRQPNLILKQSPATVVARVPAGADGSSWVLKQFRPRGGWDSLKNLFRRSRAAREFRTAVALERAGIPAARAVAAGERRRAGRRLVNSYLISEEIVGAITPHDWLLRKTTDSQQRRFVKTFAETLAQLHNAGFAHSDLNPTNFLIRCSQSDLRVWLIDMEGIVRRRKVSLSRTASDLRRLNRRVRVAAFARLRFLKWFCGARRPKLPARELAREILAGQKEWEVRRFGKRRWKVRLHLMDSQARALMADPLSASSGPTRGDGSVSVSPLESGHPGFVLLKVGDDPSPLVDAETVGFTAKRFRAGRVNFVLKRSSGWQDAQSNDNGSSRTDST